jgi:proteasome lid subunit RPN8/RPN11
MIETSVENPLVRIDSEVTRRVRQHARAHMQTEVCGVLIGKLCDGIIEIEAPIEAFNATQAGAHVTFTQAAWETIYRVKDKDYPQERIVGWYHSHPGFGVFLSDYDTFIHRNFFSSPDQVAWVYDPHSDEEGCFGWVGGSIHRLASIHVADSNGEGPQQTGKPSAASMQFPEAQMPRPAMAARRAVPSRVQRTIDALLSRVAATGRRIFAGWVYFGRWLLLLHRRQQPLSPPFETTSGQATEPLTSESRQ